MKSVAVVAALVQLVAVADAFAVAGKAPLRSARVAPQMSVGACLAPSSFLLCGCRGKQQLCHSR